MAAISDFAKQFHKVTGLYGFLVNRQGKCSDFVVESKDSALFFVSAAAGLSQEPGGCFAGREFLPSGTDTDLERAQSRFVFGLAKAVLHRSEQCETGAGFVGRESLLSGPPPILTVRDRGRFQWSGASAGWD